MLSRQLFDQLFRQQYEPMFRFCHQFIKTDEDCYDLVSAAFEDVWRNAETLQPEKVNGYLYTTVRNKAIDYIRKQGRHKAYIKYAEAATQIYVNDEHLRQMSNYNQIVDQVMQQIKPPTSLVLKACYVDKKKYKEVAGELNMSVASVKKHMVKALKMLRELKEKHFDITV